MAVTNFSTLLGLALPTSGDLAGTWGDTVNNSITSLLDTAVAGTTTLSTDLDVTLTTTNGASNQARSATLLFTGARTADRTITAPAHSKAYIAINETTGGFNTKIVGVGPTTGVTVAANERCVIAWDGSDFVKIATSVADGVTSVAMTVPSGLSVSGSPITSTGTLAVTTALSGIIKGTGSGFTAAVSGTDYAPATSGTSILKGSGSGGFSSAVSGTDYAPATSGTSILYGSGSGGFSNVTIGSGISFAAGTLSATGSGGTITSVTASAPLASSGGTTPNISFTGTLAIVNGGTGATTASAARTALGLAIGTDVPSPTGTGASGTWGINISGNAATATSATSATSATTATSASTAAQLATTNFTIMESGGKLVFKYGSTVIASMDSSGNIISAANVTGYGTP